MAHAMLKSPSCAPAGQRRPARRVLSKLVSLAMTSVLMASSVMRSG
jgi:hypothetical protein